MLVIHSTEDTMESNNKLIVHDYKGHCIYQRPIDSYVDLTQMCRVYGKRYPDWRRLKVTKEYIHQVSITVGIPTTDLVVTTLEGAPKNRGSWGHRLVALNLAKWLDPAFEVWCNQHLLELMETGTTSIPNEVVAMQKDNEDFWFYLKKLIELKPMLEKDKDLAKQMFKHIYENL